MKYIIFFLITVLLSCSSDEQIDLNNRICDGIANVTKNGNSQTMTICMGVAINNVDISNRYVISFDNTIDSDNSEGLIFTKVKSIFTEQELRFQKFIPDRDVTVASYLTSYQQDISNDRYDIDTTKIDNFLIIESYDEERKEISGGLTSHLILLVTATLGLHHQTK